jgi:hypothetical protein
MDMPIKNITDLRMEIYRLRGLEEQQSKELINRFNSPSAVFSTIKSLFMGPPDAEGNRTSGFFNQDLVGMISRFVLPFTLNKTIFRNSGFIVKTLVGLVSQKASHFINEGVVTSLWEKASSLFKKKDPQEAPAHKGVPPLSETY